MRPHQQRAVIGISLTLLVGFVILVVMAIVITMISHIQLDRYTEEFRSSSSQQQQRSSMFIGERILMDMRDQIDGYSHQQEQLVEKIKRSQREHQLLRRKRTAKEQQQRQEENNSSQHRSEEDEGGAAGDLLMKSGTNIKPLLEEEAKWNLQRRSRQKRESNHSSLSNQQKAEGLGKSYSSVRKKKHEAASVFVSDLAPPEEVLQVRRRSRKQRDPDHRLHEEEGGDSGEAEEGEVVAVASNRHIVAAGNNYAPVDEGAESGPAGDGGDSQVVDGGNHNNHNDVYDDDIQQQQDQQGTTPCWRTQAFYYPWYATPEQDGAWLHWNHPFMPHWQSSITNRFPKGRHQPPLDIGAAFYPSLGPYSSQDPKILQAHMEQLQRAGVGVIVVSWFPPTKHEENGKPLDALFPAILDAAKPFGIKVAIHSEPYQGRTALQLKRDVQYVIQRYGNHPALFKVLRSHLVNTGSSSSSSGAANNQQQGAAEKPVPVVYVYDAYHVSMAEWASILTDRGSASVRGDDNSDFFAIGLMLNQQELAQYLDHGGFDGVYTYFASNRFTYGSNWHSWSSIQQEARKRGKLFVPSVGPGYNDLQVRPWNSENTKRREGGGYYNQSWQKALDCIWQARDSRSKLDLPASPRKRKRGPSPFWVSVTSFNEWHEGTQIEAVSSHPPNPKDAGIGFQLLPFNYETYTLKDGTDMGPNGYLDLTRYWSDRLCRFP